MKISILLPYKENFSPEYAGAVSIFVKDTTFCSQFRNNITVIGNTDYKKKLLNNYVNLNFTNDLFQSSTKKYIENFLLLEKNNTSEIIEIHNRPAYLNNIYNNTNAKLVLYFHNDPLTMFGSKKTTERILLINK